MEKPYLVKKKLYKTPKQPALKRQFTEWKCSDFPVKKKYLVQWSVKKVMLIVFWEIKEPVNIDFFF